MIKTHDLDKYFNKGKANSIHVINHTNLEFPSTGLVSLVGQSGSGKTTLLNVISGLDKAKGTIEFDGVELKGYSNKWDKIRSHDIGYIFQNYYLLEDMTVKENISITLTMIGIVDKEEIEYRTNYVLNAVGMFRYRNKKASDLSGGQKQRVAIARAIAKNPKVIIADEPTGNLDSANSVEVLKIIKKISEERLVILVTHNMQLAYKYSDRIVSLKDGQIVSNEENLASDSTDITFDDKNLYLGNLNEYSSSDNVKMYSNADMNDLDVMLIKINNHYYLKPLNDNVRVTVIDNKSVVKVIDGKKEDYHDKNTLDTNFSLNDLEKYQTKRVKKRTLSIKEAFVSAYKKLNEKGAKAKILLLALLALGSMFASSIHGIVSNLVLDTSKIYTDPNVYNVSELDVILPSEDYIRYNNNYYYLDFIVGNHNFSGLQFEQPLPIEAITKKGIAIKGNTPSNYYEILIDDSILEDDSSLALAIKQTGIYTKDQLIGQRVSVMDQVFTIVGTVTTNTKAIYFDKLVLSNYYGVVSPIYDGFKLIDGRLPVSIADETSNIAKFEVVVLYQEKGYKLGDIFESDDNSIYEVVGFHNDLATRTLYYISPDSIENYVTHTFHKNNTNYSAVYKITDLPKNIAITNAKDFEIEILSNTRKNLMRSSLVQMIIALVVSGIIFFLQTRSALTTRVKEISILRSLGVSKYEVTSLFTVEYFLLTLFTSFIGVLISTYFVNVMSNSFMGEFLPIRITPLSVGISVVGIFIFNIVLAIIPVITLLRKTPAAMLTNYDI